MECRPVSFAHLEIKEREGLQHVLRDHIAVLGDDLLVISEEYGDWEDARRRIDLLALDKQRRLVVIELKRTDSGGHMELQAIRYAAMVSAMTFDQVVNAHEAYLARRGRLPAGEAADHIRDFLELVPDDEADISTDVRVILVSGDFSREITTAVLWLNRFNGMDIRCVRLVAYEISSRTYLDIEQVIPLPQAADYQVRIRRKEQQQEKAQIDGGADWTRYQIIVDGEAGAPLRKRRAVLAMVQQLSRKGIRLEDISKILPSWRLRVIPGQVEGLSQIERALVALGVSEPGRYFTDVPFAEDGKTYVLAKMWGRGTEPTLTALRDTFPAAGVTFRAEELPDMRSPEGKAPTPVIVRPGRSKSLSAIVMRTRIRSCARSTSANGGGSPSCPRIRLA